MPRITRLSPPLSIKKERDSQTDPGSVDPGSVPAPVKTKAEGSEAFAIAPGATRKGVQRKWARNVNLARVL